MDIGTAKPGPDERRRVPHHLIDVLDPWESSSVAWWLDQAAACCRAIEQRGRQALFVGGTPLYLKALLHGLFAGPPADLALRARLEEEAAAQGVTALHGRLAKIDPVAAARIHPNDLRRIIRALEVWELTGRPISAWQVQWRSAPAEAGERESAMPRVLWFDLPREELYRRIDARVEHMMAAGFVDEVRALRQLPRPMSREAAQALGYKEVGEYLDGRATLDETIDRIKTRSRQFAKRQLTWFRSLPPCLPASRELTIRAWRLTME
jgi:tRNA dimethylallyltransferase